MMNMLRLWEEYDSATYTISSKDYSKRKTLNSKFASQIQLEISPQQFKDK